MKDTNQMKWVPKLYYIVSACYMFTGFLQMFGNGKVSTAMIFMSLGWINLALATITSKKTAECRIDEAHKK